MDDADVVEVRAERMVAGGRALSRTDDGEVVLVAGALPGERVRARVHRRKGAALGELDEVLEAAPGRVAPPCPHLADGCGGCDWQHATPDLQERLRLEIVADALRRLGHLEDPVVRAGPGVDPAGSRTSVRLGVVAGRLGLRHHASHDVVALDACLVAAPRLSALLGAGEVDPGEAEELVLRVGPDDEPVLLVADPSAEGVEAPPDVDVVGGDELDAGTRRWGHVDVAGVRLRVSARSFQQASTAGAEALVAVVAEQLDGAPDGVLVDLYGGVGLFAATVGRDRPVVVVERSRSAAADARHNLRDHPHKAKVIGRAVARWTPNRAAVVVADPSRAGLGAGGVAKVVATDADRVVLVSCDAAALGRDAGALVAAGYRHVESVVVSMFGHTSHVEVASRFDRVVPD